MKGGYFDKALGHSGAHTHKMMILSTIAIYYATKLHNKNTVNYLPLVQQIYIKVI